MFFGVRNVPAELLAWVVDTTAAIEEMQWALAKYRGDPAVGSRFFDIEYDYAAFKTGATKKVTEAGFNLPNILKHGGVCADQAVLPLFKTRGDLTASIKTTQAQLLEKKLKEAGRADEADKVKRQMQAKVSA